MTSLKKTPRPADKQPPRDSHWVAAAKEVGTAVALAALPILIKTASEALARSTEKRAARKNNALVKPPKGA